MRGLLGWSQEDTRVCKSQPIQARDLGNSSRFWGAKRARSRDRFRNGDVFTGVLELSKRGPQIPGLFCRKESFLLWLRSSHRVAVQTNAFECLTKSSDNDGVRKTMLKVDNPISLYVLVSNISSLLQLFIQSII